ncbi:MAG: mechanosensitive ion channel family protein [Dehalococcoidia bacterium]|jgi:small conductance mechanosensitive channel|nr:mechanosensitive ion channel family protein [Dehalococcoidia bacterium]
MRYAIDSAATFTMLWAWFAGNAIWILMCAALALALLVFGKPRLMEFVSRHVRSPHMGRVQRLLSIVIATLDAITIAVIATAAVAITITREGPQDVITPESIQRWFLSHGLLILLIATISYLLYRLLRTALPGIVESSMSSRGRGRKAREELARRVQTLSGALTTLIGVALATIAAFMILGEMGVDVTPLLATAGVAGIAIGLGAQSLIKDMLAGLFILMEDQYNKGDVVKVAGISGLVEDVNLKRTVLRDMDGIVHSIPNGEITIASNYTKEYSRVNLDVRVAYGEDMEHVIRVINRIGEEMAKDPVWGPKLRSAPQSLGVNKFGESGIEIKVVGDTKPMMQWEVMREFRLRIKKTFDQEHIEIPWPHVKLYYGQSQREPESVCPACRHTQPAGGSFCARCGAAMPAEKTGPESKPQPDQAESKRT